MDRSENCSNWKALLSSIPKPKGKAALAGTPECCHQGAEGVAWEELLSWGVLKAVGESHRAEIDLLQVVWMQQLLLESERKNYW